MNKVININFQGRVIPIEEPAYEELKKYVESLRAHFANEEGREEIINDIENRIAELFSEKLKVGDSPFIAEQHVLDIIASIGRPEQFDEVMIDDEPSVYSSQQEQKSGSNTVEPRGSLYRNANDKMLGGVCSGLANYFRIDTTIVRVLFAVLTVGSFGTGFLLYVILWAILPSKEMIGSAIARKLYRNSEQKVLGGVCSGIAKYFNIAVWIPRLIFALPFLMGVFGIPFILLFFPLAASFSGTMFFIYIVLWAVVPKAVTASEKLEMSGERVDLGSIKNKVQDELSGVKKNMSSNAASWKANTANKVEDWGKEVNESATGIAQKTKGNRLLKLALTLIKIFLLFVFSIVAISLVAAIFGIGAAATVLMPLKNFIADGDAIQWYALGTLLLFILVPIIAIIQWLIRAIIGHKMRSNVIGITLGTLWFLGWISVAMLGITLSKQFKRTGAVSNEIAMVQPSNGKLKIGFTEGEGSYYPLDPWDNDVDFSRDTDGILLSKNEDSLLLSNIKIKFNKSRDTQFHVNVIKRSKASTAAEAEQYAQQISYSISQQDSILILPIAFPITQSTKFRNQQVLVEIEVPVGKEIYLDGRADELSWYNIRSGRRGLIINLDDDYDEDDQWRSGVWYIMKERGIEKKYPEQGGLEERIEHIKEGIRREIDIENIDLDNMEFKIKDGDTTVDVKIKI